MRRNYRPFIVSCLVSFFLNQAIAADKTVADRGLDAAIQQALYSVESAPGGFTAINPAQQVSTRFTAGGASLEYRQDSVGLRLSGYGYGESLLQPAAPRLTGSGNRIEYQRGGLTEWYVNQPAGVEQGFTLAQRPGSAASGERLTIAMEVTGGMQPVLTPAGDAVLLDRDGHTRLRYTGLRAWDAAGRELEARLEVRGREVRLEIADAGAVYPVTVDPWVQQAELLAADGAGGDYFGFSVAVSGDTAVIGAVQQYAGARGVAYVFTYNGYVWEQQAELTAADGAGGNYFGYSVAVDGNTAVIGASGGVNGQDSGANGQGAAYVFTRSFAGSIAGWTWTQQAKLVASDGVARDEFGNSVAISGDTAVIGAPFHVSAQGAAYVFTRSGLTWTQQAELVASDGVARDEFGNSVAISGDTVLIGAMNHTSFQGAAYVFTFSGTAWTQQPELLAADGVAQDLFGTSVAVSGDTAVIGAPHNGSQGVAYVFTYNGVAWEQQAELTAANGVGRDFFGHSVAVSGDTAVIGRIGPTNAQLAAYVFADNAGVWTQQTELTASDGLFGSSVAVSGDVVFVGAPIMLNQQGAAYVFDIPYLTVASTPVGLSFTAAGAGCPSGALTAPYVLPPGTACQISFPSPNSTGTATYTFEGWSDGNVSNTRSFPLAFHSTAQFVVAQYLLAGTANPVSGGQVTGSGWYNPSTNATVAAIPNPGYLFTGFSGSLTGAVTPQTLWMNGPMSVTGSFVPLPGAAMSALISSKAGAQNGRVWTLTLTNNGPGVAYAPEIYALMLTQTYGTACAPLRLSPVAFPIGFSGLTVGGQGIGQAEFDFTGCPANARFTVVVGFAANSGSSGGATTLANQTM